ncbi:metallopeptidase activity [Aspergillus sclerotialis]|uniref:Metallopeptidase activity n=1 Tax=Aspergillus sclerotialis TaxID=2070753 RepID=A0A3A2ZFP0_9EURO|nr:metallopeptidase activity [Aspergillus sclerotialis]
MAALKTLFLFAITAATALPSPMVLDRKESQPLSSSNAPWDAGATTQFPIHPSCNVTQRRQIEQGLNETVELAAHAKAHILRWGNESDIYQKYFGNRPSLEPIGAFDLIAKGNRDVLFRCDNPDGNCQLEDPFVQGLTEAGYAGHWRGENGTDETVICELSYHTRRSLTTMCALGYNIAESETNVFWASDLMHRLYHMPAFGQHWVDHYADDYEEVVDMAKSNKTYSTHDSEALQYFALETYAYDIAVPGVGCPGPQHDSNHAEVSGSSSAGASPTSTTTQSASAASDIPEVSSL